MNRSTIILMILSFIAGSVFSGFVFSYNLNEVPLINIGNNTSDNNSYIPKSEPTKKIVNQNVSKKANNTITPLKNMTPLPNNDSQSTNKSN